jgi:outer membrane protein insertion porin family
MRKYFFSILVIILFSVELKAEIINKIIIKNNDRVSEQTIINFSKIKVGDDVSDKILNNSIKELYDTNFFSDVSIKIEKNTLIINVTENKIVQSIVINGIKAKKFKEAIFDEIKLTEKSPYNEFLASKDLVLIKEVLIAQGFFFSEVSSSIINNENNNTIDLVYDIKMGDKALIKNIQFTGNKIFKTSKLRNIITSEENKFWKFLSSKRFLNNEQIKLDERLLKRFYLNNGYYDVNISSVFAKLLDTGHFKIVFNINAGNIYTINNALLSLPIDYDPSNFTKISDNLEKIKGTEYSFLKIDKIINEIDRISLEKEYEFINASIEENILNGDKLDLKIVISETEKKYVERINIFGNNITQENVIRNSLAVDEGDPFNELLQTKSLNNLKSLNIFKSVDASVREGSTESTKIIDIRIKEKPTGEISLGAGVGTDGGTMGFAVTENNYMGKGIRLRSSLRLSADSVKGQFSVLNPNYKNSDKSVFTNVQSSTTDRLTENGYKLNKTGFTIGTKFEQYEDLYFSPSINTYFENIETNSAATDALKKQEGNNFDTSFGYSLDFDKRNQKFMATDGFRSEFTQRLPLLSDTYSVANYYTYSMYNKLPNDMVTYLSFYAAAINGITGEDVKISERVKLPRSRLKGFEYSKVGPVDNGNFVGGNYATSLNLSTSLPMFFQSLDTADVSYFIDLGNVWEVDYSSTIDDSNKLRSSTGVTVNWFTPIGPLNFSLAQPITKSSTDKTQSFQFSLGTTF